MPAEKREKRLDEFEWSGLSGTKFAALAGINYQTFASWVIRRKRERRSQKAPASAPDQVRWLEAMVQEAAGSVHWKDASVICNHSTKRKTLSTVVIILCEHVD